MPKNLVKIIKTLSRISAPDMARAGPILNTGLIRYHCTALPAQWTDRWVDPNSTGITAVNRVKSCPQITDEGNGFHV